MKPVDFIKEHTRLIKILKSGTKNERVKEAVGQKKELMKFLKKLPALKIFSPA
jgi:hypothetical protein